MIFGIIRKTEGGMMRGEDDGKERAFQILSARVRLMLMLG
jgi:hypothetical protein